MKATITIIILAATAVVVGSAPAMNDGSVQMNTVPEQRQQWEAAYYNRERRSQYPQYVSPCAAAAAASSPIPAIAPAAYQVNLSPYHPYPAAHSYYAPHYRMMEFGPEQETMSYSDMDFMTSEHLPMARYAGYASPSHQPANYAPVVPAVGPVYSVFPNAKSGGCSVPLLFSCAPSIVPGHLVHGSHSGYGDSYRGVEGATHHEAHSQDSHEDTVQEHLTPVHDSSHTTMVHQ